MAVSFSAEYLYQGAKVLSSNPINLGNRDNESQCPEAVFAVARVVYSLGVLVIAPCGILYHGCAAGVYAMRSFFDERNVQTLNQCVEQHIEAAAYDVIALGATLTSLVLTAGTVLVLFFKAYDLIPILALTFAAPLIAVLNGEESLLGQFFLSYGYAENPESFKNFLSRETAAVYGAFYTYDKMVRSGLALDAPLSIQDIADLDGIANNRGDHPFAQPAEFLRFLLRTGKIAPRYRERVQAFVDHAPQMRQAFIGALNAAAAYQGTEEGRRAFLAQTLTDRMTPILAALPPIGMPA